MREQTPPIFYTLFGREDLAFAEGVALHVQRRCLIGERCRPGTARPHWTRHRPFQHRDHGSTRKSTARFGAKLLLASLAGIFASLATFLASLGMYAALSQAGWRRPRELAPCRLGAGAGAVLRTIAFDIGVCVLPGVTGPAPWLTWLSPSRSAPLLYEVETGDAPSMAAGPAVVLAAALLGALLPSLAGLPIQPSETLREERTIFKSCVISLKTPPVQAYN